MAEACALAGGLAAATPAACGQLLAEDLRSGCAPAVLAALQPDAARAERLRLRACELGLDRACRD